MARTQHKQRIGLSALLFALVGALALGLSGAAVADLTANNDAEVELESANDTIVVDVEFSDGFVDNTSATVTVADADGIQIASDTLDVDSADFESDGDTVWRTAEFSDFDEAGNYTVSLEADDPDAINSTEVTVEAASGSGGLIAGASQTHLAAFGLVVLGLIVARNREMI